MSDQEHSNRWYPGMRSPNPGGRPRAVIHLQDLAREHTPAAIEKILALMSDPKASRRTQLAAARELLDRAWGRPAQEVSAMVTVDDVPDLNDPTVLYDVARRLAFVLTGTPRALKETESQARTDTGALPINSVSSITEEAFDRELD